VIFRRADQSVPLAGIARLRTAADRTIAMRLIVAAALLVGLGATWQAARALAQAQHDRPPAASGVLVLDLSSSVGPATYRRIRTILADLQARHAHLGVVIFSDTAYEVVPPSPDPTDLAPIARFFKPHKIPINPSPFPPRLIENPHFFDNPWSTSYHGGTRVSRGLALARQILRRDRIRGGRVILMSDLNNSGLDQTALTHTLLLYGRERIKLEIVDLSPQRDAIPFYENLLGRSVALTPPHEERGVGSPFPARLVELAAALVGLLALYEAWSAPLAWRRRLAA
jgi:hypothetical protein